VIFAHATHLDIFLGFIDGGGGLSGSIHRQDHQALQTVRPCGARRIPAMFAGFIMPVAARERNEAATAAQGNRAM
jgi:hypothetical protein